MADPEIDGGEIEPAGGAAESGHVKRSRKQNPLASRIKRLMQADEDVGKIAQATPVLIGRALELLLGKLCSSAAAIAEQHHAKTLTPAHLKAAVGADSILDFLMDAVADAAELPPPKEAKPKRKRAPKAAAHPDDPQAPPPKKRAPRKRKKKVASDSEESDAEAAAAMAASASDSDEGAGARRKPAARKRAVSATGGQGAGRGSIAQRPVKRAEPDVELSDAEDMAADCSSAGGAQPAVDDSLGGGWTVASVPVTPHTTSASAKPSLQDSQPPAAVQGAEQQQPDPKTVPLQPDAISVSALHQAEPAPQPLVQLQVPAGVELGPGGTTGPAPEEDDYD